MALRDHHNMLFIVLFTVLVFLCCIYDSCLLYCVLTCLLRLFACRLVCILYCSGFIGT